MTNQQALNFVLTNDPDFAYSVARLRKRKQKLIKDFPALEEKIAVLKIFHEKEFKLETRPEKKNTNG